MIQIDVVSVTDILDHIKSKSDHLNTVITSKNVYSIEDEQALVERIVELIIQAMIDIGSHVLARQFSIRPKSYAEVFLLLKDNKVITNTLYNKIEGLSGLRNLLVHDYFTIEFNILKKNSYELVTDSKNFINEINRWLKSNR